MLSAVLYGKRLGTGFAGLRLKIGETQGAEDVLTASVFERIGYLPDDIFIDFINTLFGNRQNISSLDTLSFWTRWKNGSVEPDVVLSCGEQTIIVEAKRYDHIQQQYSQQLAKEIKAAYDEGITNPILLTVGGMYDYSTKSMDSLKTQIDNQLHGALNYTFYAVSWQQLYHALQLAIDKSQSKSLQRLLSDIREAYAWHGIRHQPRQWLGDIVKKNYPIDFETIPCFKHRATSWKRLHTINLTYETFPSFIGE